MELSSAVATAPGLDLPGGGGGELSQGQDQEKWYNAMAGVIVAGIGILVLFGMVLVAILTLPDGETKTQNVVAVTTSAFGVLGTIVGAYFGVRAANRAVDKITK